MRWVGVMLAFTNAAKGENYAAEAVEPTTKSSKETPRVEKFKKLAAEHGISEKHAIKAAGEALPPKTHNVGGIAGDQLRSIVERIERLEEDKQGIADDIKEVFAEAKGNGYDIKTLRQIIRLRKMDVSDRHEAEMRLDTYIYMRALGMQPELDFDAEPEAST